MKKIMIYTLILIAVVLIGFGYSVKYGKKDKKKIAEYQKTEKQTEQNIYAEMRKMAFSVTAKELGLQIPNNSKKIYGIISDFNLGEGTVTVVTFITGDASIYLSTGGGFIGSGQHESVKKVSKEFVDNGHLYSYKGEKSNNLDLPKNGNINFYFLSNLGQTKITESISKIENRESEFHKLFVDLNKVMTEIRMKNEQ